MKDKGVFPAGKDAFVFQLKLYKENSYEFTSTECQ